MICIENGRLFCNSRYLPSKKSLMADSDMYQEMLLHIAMAGVQRFLWWRYSHDMPLTSGIELANCVMQEADQMVGDPARQPLSLDDTVSLSDGYVLAGMALSNGTKVWRYLHTRLTTTT